MPEQFTIKNLKEAITLDEFLMLKEQVEKTFTLKDELMNKFLFLDDEVFAEDPMFSRYIEDTINDKLNGFGGEAIIELKDLTIKAETIEGKNLAIPYFKFEDFSLSPSFALRLVKPEMDIVDYNKIFPLLTEIIYPGLSNFSFKEASEVDLSNEFNKEKLYDEFLIIHLKNIKTAARRIPVEYKLSEEEEEKLKSFLKCLSRNIIEKFIPRIENIVKLEITKFVSEAFKQIEFNTEDL